MFASSNATKHSLKQAFGVVIALTSLSCCVAHAQAQTNELEQLIIGEVPYSSPAIRAVEAATQNCIAGLGSDAQSAEFLQCYIQENQRLEQLLSQTYKGAMSACSTIHAPDSEANYHYITGSLEKCQTTLQVLQASWVAYKESCLALPSELFFGVGIDAEIRRALTLSELLKSQISYLEEPLNNLNKNMGIGG